MTVTMSLVKFLKAAGYTAYDQDVPENAELPYIWLGRSGTQEFDVLDAESIPENEDVDLEVWGEPYSQIDTSNRGMAIRKLLGEVKPGPFGDGRLCGIQVNDQFEDYVYRNVEGDDILSLSKLRLKFIYYREDP